MAESQVDQRPFYRFDLMCRLVEGRIHHLDDARRQDLVGEDHVGHFVKLNPGPVQEFDHPGGNLRDGGEIDETLHHFLSCVHHGSFFHTNRPHLL